MKNIIIIEYYIHIKYLKMNYYWNYTIMMKIIKQKVNKLYISYIWDIYKIKKAIYKIY